MGSDGSGSGGRWGIIGLWQGGGMGWVVLHRYAAFPRAEMSTSSELEASLATMRGPKWSGEIRRCKVPKALVGRLLARRNGRAVMELLGTLFVKAALLLAFSRQVLGWAWPGHLHTVSGQLFAWPVLGAPMIGDVLQDAHTPWL